MWYCYDMRKYAKEAKISELQISLSEFLESFNKNMPVAFPRVSVAQLQKFKETHESLFKSDGLWSLDQHRKKIIDWLSRKENIVK